MMHQTDVLVFAQNLFAANEDMAAHRNFLNDVARFENNASLLGVIIPPNQTLPLYIASLGIDYHDLDSQDNQYANQMANMLSMYRQTQLKKAPTLEWVVGELTLGMDRHSRMAALICQDQLLEFSFAKLLELYELLARPIEQIPGLNRIHIKHSTMMVCVPMDLSWRAIKIPSCKLVRVTDDEVKQLHQLLQLIGATD